MLPTNDVIAYGTISLDNIVRLPHLPKRRGAATVTADYYKLGGGALNVAMPLAVWGHGVVVVGNQLGEDAYGDFIYQELERFPLVDDRWFERNPRVRTPFSRILVTPDGERHTLHYWFEQAPRVPMMWEMMSGTRLLSTDRYGRQERVRAARMAKEVGLLVVASDLHGVENELLPLCDWVLLSRNDLRQQAAGVEPTAHLAALRERNPRATIVLTRGPEPVLLLTPEGEWLEVPPYPLPPLERMGAGDIFKAGVIHAILDGMPLLETIRFASAAAALWVAQPAALKRPSTLKEIQILQEERGTLPSIRQPGEAEQVCPICRRVVSAALFEKHWQLDARVVRALRDRHPAWRRADGACPTCVHEMVQQVGLNRATANLPRELGNHPIYGQAEPAALPIGVRLRANPHYAGRGVRIAFLDSGFYPHPDLTQPRNRILDFVDATTDEIVVGADFSVPQHTSWHGMMTSVGAAGNGFLSQGYYAGLAREAELLLIKVSDPQMRIDEKDILRGLRWLLEHWRAYGIQIVNFSVGGDPGVRPDSELNQMVNQLVGEGVVVVAAAGNAGQNDLCPPASATRAITVGGLDDQNTLDPATNRMWHSNWGRIDDQTLKPELIAPSIWLAAPVLPGTATAEQMLILDRLRRAPDSELPHLLQASLHDLSLDPSLPDEATEAMRRAVLQKLIATKFISPFYQHVDGTSFAAPIVSSVVAQMLEANPQLTPQRIKELLIATAQPLPYVPEEQQGYGVVMPGQAVAAAHHERYGSYEPGDLSPQVEGERVRFILHEPRAERVSVIGEWNEWDVSRPAHARGGTRHLACRDGTPAAGPLPVQIRDRRGAVARRPRKPHEGGRWLWRLQRGACRGVGNAERTA